MFDREHARPGLGVEVDEAKVSEWHAAYLTSGPFLPYQPDLIAAEDAHWPGRSAVSEAHDPAKRSKEGSDGHD